MLRLQEEIETKEDVTNRLRNAEEEMEVHIANVERLENLLKENEKLHVEERLLEERNMETQLEIEELLKEKEELQNGVENLKSKSEEMEKAYEKEKQLLCDKITELQNKVKESESELRLHLSEDSYSGFSVEREEALPEEKPPTPQTEDLKAKIESLEEEFKTKEKENIRLKEAQEKRNNELSSLNENKAELERELRENKNEFLKLKRGYEKEIERLRATKHEVHGNEELFKENESLKKEVGTLKMSVKSSTSDLQNVSKEKDGVQSTFQEAEIAWEEEKNNLQQQLYDSCLEASSFKVSEITRL
jgi:chromosome segregation ATPase